MPSHLSTKYLTNHILNQISPKPAPFYSPKLTILDSPNHQLESKKFSICLYTMCILIFGLFEIYASMCERCLSHVRPMTVAHFDFIF